MLIEINVSVLQIFTKLYILPYNIIEIFYVLEI